MFASTRCLPVATLLILTAAASSCWAEIGPAVLRVSRDAINSNKKQVFEREQEVNDLVLGTKIKGVAQTSGKIGVLPCSSSESDGLKIVVNGVSVTKSEGRNGPAIIHSTTTTEFTATCPLHFNLKSGLVAGEISVEAETDTKTDKIGSTQSGIAGTVVRKLAEKKIAESREEATAIARDIAIKRIEGEVSTELGNRLAHLNRCFDGLLPVFAEIQKSNDVPVRLAAENGDLLIYLGEPRASARPSLPQLRGTADLIVPTRGMEQALSDRLTQVTAPAGNSQANRPANAKATPRLAQDQHWFIVHLDTADRAAQP